jgi:arsenate reductase
VTRVLFLCTHNSCRSQLAEALMNHLAGDKIKASSAGTKPAFVHPLALKVLQELGIDTSPLRSKGLDEFGGQEFDYAITLCADAEQACPVFFGKTKKAHIGFEDPTKYSGSEEERLAVFRRVRDEIKERLSAFFKQEGVLQD